MKKHITFISLGIVNILHSSFHIIQFLQSILLISMTNEHNCEKHSFIEELLHNPIFNIIWGIIGLVTLYIGIKDYFHHRACKTKKE